MPRTSTQIVLNLIATLVIYLATNPLALANEPQHSHQQHSQHQHLENKHEMPTSMGLHGMLLFANDAGIYASHLPMFHAPHNAQVVFKLSFTDNGLNQQLHKQLAQTNQVWTIVPQKFDLARLTPNSAEPMTQLTLDVVQGHFERGGNKQHSQVTATIDNMLLFNVLDMTQGKPKPTRANYIAIGNNADASSFFYIKHLQSRPDADQLVRVSSNGAELPAKISINLSKEQLHASAEELQQALTNTNNTVNIEPIYLELNELR
ncbi:hypothetical protein G3R49_00125 [Shewanella sp. WXL01]|uniref:hypothetical protein n=1 Tax=Shewanella sp. WXL01 TaxID=2709721 RepID=UPI00143830F9|nr:hypothetical protein [Shewanella sp. WXL01]NKF48980.1 hypothetical protein [Shewanella sp. WXL01]